MNQKIDVWSKVIFSEYNNYNIVGMQPLERLLYPFLYSDQLFQTKFLLSLVIV